MSLPRRDFLKTAAGAAAALGLSSVWAAERPAGANPAPVGGGLAGQPLPLPWPAGEDDTGALRFLVVGDWGWAGVRSKGSRDPYQMALGQIANAKAMADVAAARRARCVVSVGDNFYPSGVTSVDDPRWAQSYESVYNQPALQVPWHVALGNHDYHGSVQAQIDYSQKSKRWRMPARYFTVTETAASGLTVQFFFLDTCPFVPGYAKGGHSDVGAQDPAAQRAWLERELAASRADWKLVVGHHPLWTGGVRRDNTEEVMHAWLASILRQHGVQAYFCGHEHDAQHIEVGGLHCFVHGNGSEARLTGVTAGTRFAESRAGFGGVSVTATTLRVDFLDALGEVRHTAVVSR
jgi:acid phosphatase